MKEYTIENDANAEDEEDEEDSFEQWHGLNVALDEDSMECAEEECEGEEFMSGFPNMVGKADVIGDENTDCHEREPENSEDFCGVTGWGDEGECGSERKLSIAPKKKDHVEKEGDEGAGSDELMGPVGSSEIAEDAFLEGDANSEKKSKCKAGETQNTEGFREEEDGKERRNR